MANFNVSVTESIKYIPFNLSASEGLTVNIDNPLQRASYVVLQTRTNPDGTYTIGSPKNAEGSYTLSNVTKEVHDDYKAGFVVPPGGGTVTFGNTNYVSGSEFRIQGTQYHPFYDTLLDRWPNAAAAYSLRLLNSYYDGPAIRVRRSIDDTESNIGFIGTELDTTALVNFTKNVGTALPGDYGDGAAAAYSLRYVTTAYTGPVIRVRRDSDDTEQDFTPLEITDGTLETWVNEDVVTYTSNFSSGFDGVNPQKLTGVFNVDEVEGVNDTLKLTLKTGTEEWWSVRGNTFIAGNTYTITLDIYIPTSNTLIDNVRIGSTANGTDIGTVNTVGAWTTATFNFTAISSALGIRAYDGNAGFFDGNGTDHFYVKNIQVTQTTSNGFVETWYDQSGTGNHASQTTAANQPKIVNGGSVVLENGKPALSFDGVNDYISADISGFNSITNLSTAFVTTPLSSSSPDSNTMVLFGFGNANDRALTVASFTGLLSGETITNLFDNGTSGRLGSSTYSRGSNEQSIFTTYHLQTGVSIFSQGSKILLDLPYNMTTSTPASPSDTGYTTDNIVYINALKASNILSIGPAAKHQEVLFYDVNQLSNRTDIESNINNYYNIFPFDSYVETWYDQSGNGNHATQVTDANQPQIVSSGSVILENGKPSVQFDGTDDFLNASTINIPQPTSYFITYKYNNFSDVSTTDLSDGLTRQLNDLTFDGILRSFAGTNFFSTIRGSNNQSLRFSLFNSTDSAVGMNGSALEIGDVGANAIVDMNIGKSAGYLHGKIQEFTIYPSNQSSNRTNIESNINSHYKIY